MGGLSFPQKFVGTIGVLAWASSWFLIYWRFLAEANPSQQVPLNVPYFLTVGVSAGFVTLTTFYAFYVTTSRTPDESMRSSIAASLFVFYVVLITDLLVVPGFIASLGTATQAGSDQQAVQSFGQGLVSGVSTFVGVVLAFYFAASAVTDKAKTDKDAKIQSAQIAAGQTPSMTLPANREPGA